MLWRGDFLGSTDWTCANGVVFDSVCELLSGLSAQHGIRCNYSENLVMELFRVC